MRHSTRICCVVSTIAALFVALPTWAGWFDDKVTHPLGAAIQKGANDTGATIQKGANDAGATIQKGANDTGAAIQKGAQDAGKSIEKAAHDTGSSLNQANNDFHGETGRDWEYINHFLDQIDKVFCSVMTAGGSDNGTASCDVNAGVGMDNKGQPYTFDPNNPGQRYPITPSELTLPSDQELAAMERVIGPPPVLEDWEIREYDRLNTFLHPGDRFGLPWIEASSQVTYPNADGKVRPGGEFLALRKDARYPDGWRFHGGIDYLNNPGEAVKAVVTGTVTRIFQATEKGTIGIEITTDHGYVAQVLYVQPSPEIQAAYNRGEHQPINAGMKLGTAQDLHMTIVDENGVSRPAYPSTVLQHVHVTIKDPQGRFISPDGRTAIIMRKGSVPVTVER